MTDRHKGYVITLAENVREDDAKATIAAIKQIKGVVDVTPVIADVHDIIIESRVQNEIFRKLYAFLGMR